MIDEAIYDLCANPACCHYRCEHDIKLGKAVYVKPGMEEEAKQLEGQHWPGCANADCPCESFEEKNK